MNKIKKKHVTQYFYKNSDVFSIKNFANKKKNKLIKTAIDNKRDLVNILRSIKKNEFENYSISKSRLKQQLLVLELALNTLRQ